MILLHRGIQRREITWGAEVTTCNALKGFQKSRKRSTNRVRRHGTGPQAVSCHEMSTKYLWLLCWWFPHLSSTLRSRGSSKQVRGPLLVSLVSCHPKTAGQGGWLRSRLVVSAGSLWQRGACVSCSHSTSFGKVEKGAGGTRQHPRFQH